MDLVVGRQNDHLIGNQGQKIYASYFHHLLDGYRWIKAFQFRQNKIGQILLFLETEKINQSDDKIENLKDELITKISPIIGNNLKLEINVVKAIERT